MPPRFRAGAAVYDKDGRRFVVEEVAGGIVYCISSGGAEAEFAEAKLLNEAEWTARTGGRPEMLYGRVRQASAYAPYRGPLDRAAAEQLLAKAERLYPGILDFTAFVVARRVMTDSAAADFIPELSPRKCREIFDAAPVQNRAAALAGMLGSPPDRMASAVRLGDNLMRAMIDKGLEAVGGFEEFGARRR